MGCRCSSTPGLPHHYTLRQQTINIKLQTFLPMQELIILLVFLVALGYLGRRMYRSFAKKQAGCGKGCGCAMDAKAAPLLPARKM